MDKAPGVGEQGKQVLHGLSSQPLANLYSGTGRRQFLASDSVHHWLLHWLCPDAREVRTLELRAGLPLLLGWDADGLRWRDGGRPHTSAAEGEAGAPTRHTVANNAWDHAAMEHLIEGERGRRVRKQDQHYAKVLLQRDDWPWEQRPLNQNFFDGMRAEAAVRAAVRWVWRSLAAS